MVDVEGDSQTYEGVCNIGLAPTFGDLTEARVEVHLIDFDRMIYAKELEVFFKSFIRQEQKFPGLQELKEQIHKDVLVAKQRLQK